MSVLQDSYVARFEARASLSPNRTALKMDDAVWSYAELNRAANGVAHRILESGREPEAVAALFEYSPAGVAALLGVLKAGRFAVLPPPSFPKARIRYMVEDSTARLLLCDDDTAELAASLDLADTQILNINELASAGADDDPGLDLTPDSLLFVRYTSGSTGQPKGVPHTHRNILHSIENLQARGDCDRDGRHLLLGTLTTGLAVRTLLAPLVHGAAVYPFDVRRRGLAELKKLLSEEGISVMQIGPTLFRTLLDSLRPGEAFPAMRQISLIGDMVYPRDVRRFLEAFEPPCELRVGYGTSESGSVAAVFFTHESEVPADRIPAGRAVAGKQILILDEQQRPVDPGETGEIAVRSRFLSPGYWRQPELTKERFLPDPQGGDQRIYRTGDLGRLDRKGTLYHLGRLDDQIKIRGLRIEAGEIETALIDLDVFKEAVVVAHQRADGDKVLVAHGVPEREPAPSPQWLRGQLANRLPEALIPASFVFSDALPRTPNGKVIRAELPPPRRERPGLEVPFAGPETRLERDVAAIWCDLLQLDEVGIFDPFLEVGGDSLLAMRVLARIEQHFRIQIPLEAFFNASTIADLVKAIRTEMGERGEATGARGRR